MIKLTRLSGEEFILNADLIRFIEARPDTYITLTTNERFVVREGADEVVRRSIDYARSVRMVPG
jgi:flagellar protein FlbD